MKQCQCLLNNQFSKKKSLLYFGLKTLLLPLIYILCIFYFPCGCFKQLIKYFNTSINRYIGGFVSYIIFLALLVAEVGSTDTKLNGILDIIIVVYTFAQSRDAIKKVWYTGIKRNTGNVWTYYDLLLQICFYLYFFIPLNAFQR